MILICRGVFLGQVKSLEPLQRFGEPEPVRVKHFDSGELHDFIEKPATMIGLKFEQGLIEQLVDDVLGDPAALPLLHCSLRKLWEKRTRNRVTWDAYCELGGAGMLERSLEDFHRRLNPEERETAKRMLLQLVRPIEGRDIMTQRIRQSALYEPHEAHDQVDQILQELKSLGFVRLVKDETSVDLWVAVRHEAMVFHWPTLLAWVDGERDKVRWRLSLSDNAEEWKKRDRDSGMLWRGSLLEEAERYSDLNELQAEFVRASREAVDRAHREELDALRRERAQAVALAHEQEERATCERKLRIRIQRLMVGLAVALAFSVAWAFTAYAFYRQAKRSYVEEQKARVGEHQQRYKLTVARGAQSFLEGGDLSQAGLWFSEALRMDEQESLPTAGRTVFAEEIKEVHQICLSAGLRQFPFLSQLWQQVPLERHLVKEPDKFLASTAEFSRDGRLILTASGELGGTVGDARFWDSETGRKTGFDFRDTEGRTTSAVLSPDGKWVATGGASPTSNKGWVRLWRGKTGEQERKFDHPWGGVNHIAFSSDSRYLAMASGKPGSGRGEVQVWNTEPSGQDKPTVHLDCGGAAMWGVFSPDGSLLATASGEDGGNGGRACVWELPDPGEKPVLDAPHSGRVNRVAFSANGQRIITASGIQGAEFGEAQVWDVKERKEVFSVKHRDGVTSAEFSPCGRLVLTAGHDAVAVLWDSKDGRWLHAFRHGSSIYHATFSPDGRYIATASRDQTARVWEVATREPVMPAFCHNGTVSWAWFSPDSRRLLTVSRDLVRLWELANDNPPPRLLKVAGDVRQVMCSPDARYVVVASERRGNESGAGQVWDLVDVQASVKIPKELCSAAISSDRRHLVSVDRAGMVQLWELHDGEAHLEKEIAKNLKEINEVSVGPDGRHLAVAIGDVNGSVGQARIWDVKTGRELILQGDQHKGGVIAVSFNDRGDRIVTVSADDTAQVWEVASGRKIGQPLLHTADVVQAAFSADGRYVVTASMDRTAVIWDVESSKKLATLLHSGYVSHARFRADGRYLVTACHDGRARMWYLRGNESQAAGDSQPTRFTPELIALFEHGGLLQLASFNDRGDRVVTIGYYLPRLLGDLSSSPTLTRRLVQLRQWDVSPELETSEQAQGCTEVISARSFDPERQDVEILDTGPLVKQWSKWGSVYREKFAPSPDVRLSDDDQAEACEATDQWYAAVWYLDKLIGPEPAGNAAKGKADLFARRARAHGELGEWERAARDATKAMEFQTTEPKIRYWLALARLQSGDRDGYRQICLETLEAANPANDVDGANKAVWACVIVRDEKILENDEQLVEKAKAVEAEARKQEQNGSARTPILHRVLNTLGAVYYRVERYDEAVKALTESEEEYERQFATERRGAARRGDSGKVWNWLFLAMAYQHLGKRDEARSFRAKSIEALRQDIPQRRADATGVPSLSWDQRFALESLRQEALEVVPENDGSKQP